MVGGGTSLVLAQVPALPPPAGPRHPKDRYGVAARRAQAEALQGARGKNFPRVCTDFARARRADRYRARVPLNQEMDLSGAPEAEPSVRQLAPTRPRRKN